MLRFDMSEYMERHTVSRLIGAPPGYVGYDEGGLLTDGVDQHPHCVLLLDEIEKAHPDLFNILLQVMDNGALTDANGRKVDFRNVILIMTTNAGASDAAKNSIGFGRGKKDEESGEALKRLFTPEFRNRLDATIAFGGLTPEIIDRVVEKFILQLEVQLEDRNVSIEVSKAARDWLAKRGFDPDMGARPLSRRSGVSPAAGCSAAGGPPVWTTCRPARPSTRTIRRVRRGAPPADPALRSARRWCRWPWARRPPRRRSVRQPSAAWSAIDRPGET